MKHFLYLLTATVFALNVYSQTQPVPPPRPQDALPDLIWTAQQPWEACYDAEFTQDEKFIYAVLESGIYKIDSQDGTIANSIPFELGKTYDIELFKDGSKAITIGEPATIRFWDLESGEIIQELPTGHYNFFANLTYDDKYLIYKRYDEMFVRNLETGEEISAGVNEVRHIAVSESDYTFVYSSGNNVLVRRFNPETKQVETPYGFQVHNNLGQMDISISHDGRYVITAGWDGRINVQDIVEKKSVINISANGYADVVGISPNGKQWLFGGANIPLTRFTETHPEAVTFIGTEGHATNFIKVNKDASKFICSAGILHLFHTRFDAASVSNNSHFITVSPNPVINSLNVNIAGQATGLTEISLTNVTGNTIPLYRGNHQSPDYQRSFDISRHPQGSYILNLSINGQVHSYNIIKGN